MSEYSWSNVRKALGAGLCLLGLGCRNDPSAPDGHAAASPTAAGALSASPPGTTREATTAPVSSTPSAAPSASAPAHVDCGGPPAPGAPSPRVEQQKLDAQRSGQYRFELAYPVFAGDGESVDRELNRLLVEQLTAIQTRFVKEAASEERSPDPDAARWFEGKCSVSYRSQAFVSVACDTMEGPGAHPNLDKFAYNFQTCPRVRPIGLADLCRSVPDCRRKLIQLINEDFRTGEKKETGLQFRDGPLGSHGEPPDMEHPIATLQSFGMTPAGLRIFLFDELPHVLQAFAVVDVPAAKLRPVLRDDMARGIWGL